MSPARKKSFNEQEVQPGLTPVYSAHLLGTGLGSRCNFAVGSGTSKAAAPGSVVDDFQVETGRATAISEPDTTSPQHRHTWSRNR